jgi:hypothetical protein
VEGRRDGRPADRAGLSRVGAGSGSRCSAGEAGSSRPALRAPVLFPSPQLP